RMVRPDSSVCSSDMLSRSRNAFSKSNTRPARTSAFTSIDSIFQNQTATPSWKWCSNYCVESRKCPNRLRSQPVGESDKAVQCSRLTWMQWRTGYSHTQKSPRIPATHFIKELLEKHLFASFSRNT